MSEAQEILKGVEEQLQQLTIISETATSNPRSGPMQHKQPVASLRIPNQFYVLTDRNNCLEKIVGTSVSKHLEMVNTIIESGAVKIHSNAATVEERLKRESYRFLKMYRNPKKGGAYRKKLIAGHTNMLLFEGEVESSNACIVAQPWRNKKTRKPFDQLGPRQQRRRKGQIRDALAEIPFTQMGLALRTVQLESVSHMKFEIKLHPQTPDRTEISEDHIPDIVYLMLKHGVSFNFYHELCERFGDLPRAYKVQEFKKDMVMPTITKTGGSFEGAQFDFDALFLERLQQEIEEHPEYYATERHFRVRISGDGARYNRNSNFCLLSFSIIRDGSINLSSANVHTIAAIKAEENYSNLAEGFKDSLDTINKYLHNPVINIEGQEYSLEFFLCADYKFLLMVMGLKNATAKHSCIWCKMEKGDRHDMTISRHEARTRADLNGSGKLSSINIPLIDVELDHVIPDELHLMLRVMDVLIQGLIDTVLAYDRHQHRLSGSRRSYKALDGYMLNNLMMAIRNCGVYFCVYEQEDGKMEWPSLLGNDKLKLLKHLPDRFGDCQPAEIVTEVKTLWKDFEGIYTTVTSRAPTTSHDLCQRAKDWVNLFLKLGDCSGDRRHCYGDGYQPNKVTPYMHILVYHIPSFINKYGNVKQFSCQGIEQNNNVAKGLFFRNSNKWDATTDILANEYRLTELKCCEREKRKYTKHDDSYWKGGGIQESRKKRPRISHGNDDIYIEDSN